ncbi:hypothetical protein Ami103574_02630 [Aminipila butyrica]|uniref:Uncharacterized protein n=1 Tax=Aminipila butyrica TaxID=433296 RepID=A0A858BT49_9FIRM|nr:hypothetical protein [Aminipila butyrica]QIB68275.1 hypothetical protein Ami103574_02630 [Aminipila butyrica]
MDEGTILLLIALIGCFVGLAGWLSGREKKMAGDAHWRGTIDGKLDAILGIDKRVVALEGEVKEHGKAIAKVEESAKSAHHRLDGMEENK